MDLAVMPECYIDTNLAETLVPTKKGYNHQHGCGTVSSKMRGILSNSFALGIIDKDKNEIDYLKEFDLIVNEGNLFLHKHKTLHHYIIQISPAIERFILDNAKATKVNLAEFGLPENLDDLRDYTKKSRSKNDHRLKELFKTIRRQGSREFELLGEWIAYLKENNYKADLETLKGL